MKINFTEENKEIFEHEIIPLFSISEFWNDYSPSLWYSVFEIDGSLRAIAFTELHDGFDIEKITDSSYGIVNVQNKTLDFNDDCDYAFYIHEQKPTNIFGFFSHFSQASLPSLYVTKETFFEKTEFIDATHDWDSLIDSLRKSRYTPSEIRKLLQL